MEPEPFRSLVRRLWFISLRKYRKATLSELNVYSTCNYDFVQLLEEICQKNNWGSPIYSLHSSTSTTASGEPDTLFLYKVTVVGIGMQYIPSKLSRNLAEAREMAAEHALIQLGYPMEGNLRVIVLVGSQGEGRCCGLSLVKFHPQHATSTCVVNTILLTALVAADYCFDVVNNSTSSCECGLLLLYSQPQD